MRFPKKLLEDIVSAWREHKATLNADVPSGEFKEDDLRHNRVRLAKEVLSAHLDRLEKKIRRKK